MPRVSKISILELSEVNVEEEAATEMNVCRFALLSSFNCDMSLSFVATYTIVRLWDVWDVLMLMAAIVDLTFAMKSCGVPQLTEMS